MIYDEFREPWMPTLEEIEYLKTHGTTEEQEYYSQFGWNQIEVSADCETISERMTLLGMRFMERYGNRLLSFETLERWQIRLQNKFDELQYRFERAYALYDSYRADMDESILDGDSTVTDGTNQASGSDSSTNANTTKTIDTPDSAINDNDDYADSLSKSDGSGSTTYGRKDTVHNAVVREIHGKGVIENVNDSMDKFRDIDTEFIKQFENMFLNVFWY